MFLLNLISAYPVNIILNGNMNFNSTIYHCQNLACSSLDSSPYYNLFGDPILYNISYLGSGNQYFAEYDYVTDKCYAPHVYIRWFSSSTGNGPWSYDINLVKKQGCNSTMIYYEQKNNILDNETQTIKVNTTGSLVFPAGTENMLIPSYLENFYSTNVRVDLEIKNSSGNIIYASNQNQDIIAGKNKQFVFNIANFSEGNYKVNVKAYPNACFCQSYNINERNSSFNVTNSTQPKPPQNDTTPPEIIVYSPLSQTYNNSLILVNFTAIDNSGIDKLWYNNGSVNISYTNPVTENLSDGTYTYIFYANDTSGNVNSTTRSFVINTSQQPTPSENDTTPPEIILIAPNNNSHVNEGNINFVYRVNDTSNISYCNLTINDVVVYTDNFVIKNTNLNIIRNLKENIYLWKVVCSDSFNNVGTTETRKLIVEKEKKEKEHNQIKKEEAICGNEICEDWLGEDEFNCEEDCKITNYNFYNNKFVYNDSIINLGGKKADVNTGINIILFMLILFILLILILIFYLKRK